MYDISAIASVLAMVRSDMNGFLMKQCIVNRHAISKEEYGYIESQISALRKICNALIAEVGRYSELVSIFKEIDEE